MMPNYKASPVDLTNCDKEPIQYIGRIQPNGFLLVIDKVTLIIEQASENVLQYFPITGPNDLLGKPYGEFLYSDGKEFLFQDFVKEDRFGPAIVNIGEN